MDRELQNVDRISFCVEVLTVKNGRSLGKIRPDGNGYYTIPLAVLGVVTENLTYYETDEFVSQMTSPTTVFNKCLTDGKLYGEFGHPKIALLPREMQIPRLMLIEELNYSHHIGKVWTGEKLESGGRIVYGLVKPFGPQGSQLKASLDDPCLNTSFSLRSIALSKDEPNLTRRRIKHLITFDYVGAGGYYQAAKRYSPSSESLCLDLPITRSNIIESVVAMERFSNTELNEIFGAKEVEILGKTTTFLREKAALQGVDGNLHSVFVNLLNNK